MNKYKHAFQCQKNQAKRRGIGWELTFEQWLEWWGEDIDRRGSSAFSLQMQRHADSGPYALGNIKKGYPKDNSATWSRVSKNKKAEKAKREHEAFLDALMWAKSKEEHDETHVAPEERADLPKMNGIYNPSFFVIDRGR